MYDKKYFARRKYANDYRILADFLSRLQPGSVLDLGCGNGLLLAPLLNLGVRVRGFEISSEAIHHTPKELHALIAWRDFLDPAVPVGVADLVCCVEVAEHILPSFAERLADVVSTAATSRIFWSAAGPYQPGTGHVNCQSQFYWLEKFLRRGFELDWQATRDFWVSSLSFAEAPWLHHNGVVLRRR